MKSVHLLTLIVFLPLTLRGADPLRGIIDKLAPKDKYITLGKLLTNPPRQNTETYYAEMLKLLESPKLLTSAQERVRKLNPGLHSVAVKIKASRTPGSSILNVTSESEEPKYTRILLDALLDEFILIKTKEARAIESKSLLTLTANVISSEKDCASLEEQMATARERSADEVNQLTKKYKEAQARFEAALQRLENYDLASETQGAVSIIQRPQPAVFWR